MYNTSSSGDEGPGGRPTPPDPPLHTHLLGSQFLQLEYHAVDPLLASATLRTAANSRAIIFPLSNLRLGSADMVSERVTAAARPSDEPLSTGETR